MTSPQSPATAHPFLPLSIVLPQDEDQMRARLITLFNDITFKMNIREIAIYSPVEATTGQQWPSTNPSVPRIGFRKTLTVTLAAPGATTVAHGLPAGFTIYHIYGVAKNTPFTLGAVLPQAFPDDVALTWDATNVIITANTATYNGFSATIVIEYLKS